MNIFIQSCHSALEYDHARMFLEMGHRVFGNWDIGSTERPKIAGVTDFNSSPDDFEFIILHQVPDYTKVMRYHLEAGKRVVLTAFGQSDTWQYDEMAKLCNKFEHAYIANYSIKDLNFHAARGCSEDKSRLIRFAKWLDDYEPWVGESGKAYAACNHIHKRGPGCNWTKMETIMANCPVTLSGVATNEVGGLGQVPLQKMHDLFRDSPCSVSLGTAPAAMTLAQIEAVCAGCPLVLFDNGFGAGGEGLTKMVHQSPQGVIEDVKRLIADKSYRQHRHEEMRESAEMFNVKNVSPLWEELIERVMV